ncbi:MAG: hypothetical protein HDR17_13290 [Lachnospiraceae bacterium]|nr:hypothetical protein [Lachnospiraceae bacterium]
MDNRDETFIWSDGWWIEGSNAWFVCGMSNVLFCIDLNTGSCEDIAYIPDPDDNTYRQTPFCLKYDRDIFCIPGFGQNIWIYNLDNKQFVSISIDKPERLQLTSQFWIWGDSVLIVPANWNKIIEVSISKKTIKNYYTVCMEDTIKKAVLTGDNIYMVSSSSSRIYQFDIVTKKTRMHILPCAEKKLATICFDGKKFWMGGYQKEVYIWEKESNKFMTIDNFPIDFSLKDIMGNIDSDRTKRPVFKYSIVVGEYIWFIPTQADKIIYADKENATLFSFEICDEEETEESIFLNQLWTIANYLLEYVRDNRYIGLFSAKSGRILEIDARNLSYQWKDCYLKDKYFFQCGNIYRQMYYEGVDDDLYGVACRIGIKKTNNLHSDSIGTQIHKKTTEG